MRLFCIKVRTGLKYFTAQNPHPHPLPPATVFIPMSEVTSSDHAHSIRASVVKLEFVPLFQRGRSFCNVWHKYLPHINAN